MNQNEDDKLFFAALTCSMVYLLRTQAYWDFIPGFLYSGFFFVALLLAALAAATKISRYDALGLAFVGFYFLISVIVGHNAQLMKRLVLSVFLIIAAKDVPLKQIFKVYFIVGTAFFASTLTAFYLGIIKESTLDAGLDREMVSAGAGIRYSMGYASPTDLANHFLYVLTAFWLYRDGKVKWVELGVMCFLIAFVAKKSGSRLSLFCSIVLVLFVLYFKVKESGVLRYYNRPFFFVIVVIAFLFIPLSVYFTNSYEDGDLTWMALDLVFSGRLRLGNEAIQEHGFCLLGQYVEMIGCAEVVEGVIDTNYIDNSYIQLFVIHGFVFATLIIGTIAVLAFRALKWRYDYVIIAIFIVSIEGVVAHHYMMLEFNPLLLSCTALLEPAARNLSDDRLLRLKKALILLKLKQFGKLQTHAVAERSNTTLENK